MKGDDARCRVGAERRPLRRHDIGDSNTDAACHRLSDRALVRRNLDLALEGVLWGAFGTTGQRCTATSRLILHRKVHDRFLRRLAEAAEGLRLGDGRADKTDVGPLIHEAARDKVAGYVGIGREQGALLTACGNARR